MLTSDQLDRDALALYDAEYPDALLAEKRIERTVEETRVRYANRVHLKCLITYHLPDFMSFSASFIKEGLFEKVTSYLFSEMQVDDPLFDKNVWIQTSDDIACRAFLTDRCQGAIMYFVLQGGKVVIEDNSLMITLNTSAEPDLHDINESLVLAAYAACWLEGAE